jgi:hypothetical protein
MCVYVDYKCNVGGLTQFENTYIQTLLYIANLIGQEIWKKNVKSTKEKVIEQT